jgi:AcrR family transcriptional regulator
MAARQNKQSSQDDEAQTLKVQETRRLILQKAQQLFMEQGYRAVSTRKIAESCGLTQPALYHHFRDKQELYVAMALEELEKTQAALERIVRRSEPIQERLLHAALYLVSITQHDLNLMLHDIRSELAPEARATLNEAFLASIVAPIAALFVEGIARGQFRDAQHDGCDPVTAAFLFLSLVSTIVNGEQRGEVIQSQRDQARQMIHILLHGLSM